MLFRSVAGVVLVVVLSLAGRGHRGPPKPGQRRGANSHYTKEGHPKRSYDTRKEAMVQARVLANKDGAPMDAYRCRECGKWHVGHEL